MNIHKLNVKPKHRIQQHQTIKWTIPEEIKQYVKKVNVDTWEIFSQENIILQPIEVKPLMLGICFIMTEGVVLTSLPYALRKKRCSIQNEVNLENTANIITTIVNNSKEVININKNTLLCLVCYKKI